MKNKLAPLSENQRAFFDRAMSSWLNVAEGGKRGGKNVLTTLAFCVLLENHPNKVHLAAGVSIATAKLNILDCDGFGMLNYFAGRCREGQYKNRDCLYVRTRSGLKVVLLSGGARDGDEKLIKGNTYGMAYITEVNECSQKFIQEVFDRTLSSYNRKVFHDLNPKSPKHWYYTDVLAYHQAAQERDPAYGYNYGHFTIADNMSVSGEQLRAVLKTYDRRSVWYRRDILGARCTADGMIYQAFANNRKTYRIKAEDVKDLMEINVAVDFGGGKSGHAFVATGITRGYNRLIALASERYVRGDQREEIDPDKLGQLFVDFCKKIVSRYGVIHHVYCDSAEQTLIAGLRTAARKSGLAWLVPAIGNALKTTINDRIRAALRLMAQGRFFYVDADCQTLDDALSGAVWNPKNLIEDERLDDGTSDIDTLDALEYTFERSISLLIRNER